MTAVPGPNAWTKEGGGGLLCCCMRSLICIHVTFKTQNDNLPVELCGCETCSVILREERRLRVFEYLVLRKGIWGKEERNNRRLKKTA